MWCRLAPALSVTSPTSRALGWHACRGWHFTSPPPPLNTEVAVTDVKSRERQVKVCSCLSFVYSQALFIVTWTVIPSFLLWKHRKASTAPHIQHRWEWHSFRMACTQLAACTLQCCKQNWKLSRKTWNLCKNSPEILTVIPGKSLTWIASHDRCLDWQLLFAFFLKTWGIIMF